jgi:hypothetical protein
VPWASRRTHRKRGYLAEIGDLKVELGCEAMSASIGLFEPEHDIAAAVAGHLLGEEGDIALVDRAGRIEPELRDGLAHGTFVGSLDFDKAADERERVELNAGIAQLPRFPLFLEEEGAGEPEDAQYVVHCVGIIDRRF